MSAVASPGVFPLSNRGETGQGLTHLPPARIDTAAITWPITGWTSDAERRTTTAVGTPDEQHYFMAPLGGGGTVMWPVAKRVKIEASLPKRVGKDNIEGVGLEDAVMILAMAKDEAREWVTFDEDGGKLAHGRVTRLDLVRDFDGVRDVNQVLTGLSTVPVAGRSKQTVHADGDRNCAQTLTVGPKSWKARLYDKHAETDGLAAQGRVRFEAEMRRDILSSVWAKANGGMIRQVADLDEQRLRALTVGMFERVGFGHEIVSLDTALGRVRAAGLSRQTENGLVNYLFSRGAGIQPRGSANTLRKYRRAAEKIGVLALDVVRITEGTPVRLDYCAGRLVTTDLQAAG